MSPGIVPPHRGVFVDLMAAPGRAAELRSRSRRRWPSWDLRPRQLCDLEPEGYVRS